jgi:hypothetical protein
MRQNMGVLESGVFVNVSPPIASAGFVSSGSQLAGIRLKPVGRTHA